MAPQLCRRQVEGVGCASFLTIAPVTALTMALLQTRDCTDGICSSLHQTLLHWKYHPLYPKHSDKALLSMTILSTHRDHTHTFATENSIPTSIYRVLPKKPPKPFALIQYVNSQSTVMAGLAMHVNANLQVPNCCWKTNIVPQALRPASLSSSLHDITPLPMKMSNSQCNPQPLVLMSAGKT